MHRTTDLKAIEYDRVTRDFRAEFDGNVIGYFPHYSAAETALNDYVLHLCESGLIDAPLAALAVPADTPEDDYSDCPAGPGEPTYKHTCDYHRDHLGRCAMCLTDEAERLFDELEARRGAYHYNSGMYRAMSKLLDKAHRRVLRRIRLQGIAGPREAVRCKNCGGAHHIQRCGEIWAALRGPDEHTVAAGRAIARHFARRPRHFIATLRGFDPAIWRALAEALCVYRGGNVEDTLGAWWLAVSETAQIPTDYRKDFVVHPIVAAADASAESYAGMTKAHS